MMSPPLTPIAAGVIDADLLRALAATNRRALERMIAMGIDILDAIDGDPDLEEDDPAGQADEDGCNTATPNQSVYFKPSNGPGCVLSDDDSDEFKRPLHLTASGRERIRGRREVIAHKRRVGIDDIAEVRKAIRKAKRRCGTTAAH